MSAKNKVDRVFSLPQRKYLYTLAIKGGEVVVMVLSSPPLDRLIRKGGAERVSKEAAQKLADMMEDYGIKISKKAIDFAYEQNRKTVRKEDIRKAIKEMSK